MANTVREHLRLTKSELLDASAPGVIPQTGATTIGTGFSVPNVYGDLSVALPSIETFVVSTTDGSIAPTGTKAELNNAWTPVVSAMAEAVFSWLADGDIALTGDAYVTASITRASEVNGEAHFDDDMYSPNEGVGFVAIAADRQGSRVCTEPLKRVTEQRRPLLSADEFKAEFEAGKLPHETFEPNTLVAFPQFGQLHAGPGPCGTGTEVRHLLVFRAATVPQ